MVSLMRKAALVLIVASLIGVVLPSQAQGEPRQFNEDGMQFSYDTSLARDVSVTRVEAVQIEEGMPFWALSPAYRQVDFEGYPNADDMIQSPRLIIYPTAEFAAYGDEQGGFLWQLENLVATLNEYLSAPDDDKPDLADYVGSTLYAPEETLSFLPVFNAAQVLIAQPRYVEFENGLGVRYLTYFAQDAYPLSDTSVFYTFQGLTLDSQYYVVAIFPLKTPLFPAEDQLNLSAEDYDNFIATFDSYLNDSILALDILPAEVFTPNLALLDALLVSLNVQ